MRIEIAHHIEYRYDTPVRPGRHTLRVTPTQDAGLSVVSHSCDISPEPQLAYHARDVHDNDALVVWFLGETDRLSFRIATTVETPVAEPFGYILDPPALSLADLYDAVTADALARYLTPTGNAETMELATRIADDAGGATLEFLSALCGYTSDRWRMVVREHGAPLEPSATLTRDEAACRDVVAVFLDVCRNAGVAARFVSGYAVPDPDADIHHMHAWAEVYLPGAGWRGYDPTSGAAVADRHVPTARAPGHVGAEPIAGTVSGDDVSSQMTATVNIKT